MDTQSWQQRCKTRLAIIIIGGYNRNHRENLIMVCWTSSEYLFLMHRCSVHDELLEMSCTYELGNAAPPAVISKQDCLLIINGFTGKIWISRCICMPSSHLVLRFVEISTTIYFCCLRCAVIDMGEAATDHGCHLSHTPL
ncbi:hypothetical protein MUK42_08203 [Musa troglodytarum]|uniref:Uncharacterized protein n=1 Tax=Musa troglodytarum TaxID=320322 RepID=A0A9E7E8X0_9LILI|nr:hypothetical protein MUK42_08203 [Musa troglodytarum]